VKSWGSVHFFFGGGSWLLTPCGCALVLYTGSSGSVISQKRNNSIERWRGMQ